MKRNLSLIVGMCALASLGAGCAAPQHTHRHGQAAANGPHVAGTGPGDVEILQDGGVTPKPGTGAPVGSSWLKVVYGNTLTDAPHITKWTLVRNGSAGSPRFVQIKPGIWAKHIEPDIPCKITFTTLNAADGPPPNYSFTPRSRDQLTLEVYYRPAAQRR